MSSRSPLASGFDAAFRHLRLALCVWLFLLIPALVAWRPFHAIFDAFDRSLFRESLLKGWDSWGVLSFLALGGRELAIFGPIFVTLLAAGLLLQVFVTGGVLRVLIADVERPVLRRLVSESAALFRQNLWATARFALSLIFWEGILVGIPVAALGAIQKKGEMAPNGPLATLSFWWILVVGTIVLLNAVVRLDLARVAIARGDSPTARGAYRVAKMRLEGSRVSALALLAFWLAAAYVCQLLFTRVGIAMNPSTDGGITALVVVRQFGFVALAMMRVGWWASLLAWEKRRRPMAMPIAEPVMPVVTISAA